MHLDPPKLTRRQQEVLNYIKEGIAAHGYPPTIREIGDALNIKSTNGVSDHLKALVNKGVLRRTEAKSRSCVPTDMSFLMDGSMGPTVFSGHVLSENTTAYGDGSQSGLSATKELEWVDLDEDSEMDVPVLGRVAAGQPILAVEQAEDSVRIDRMLIGHQRGKDVFALRVVGESMIEDGIYDGDFIFVKKQREAPRGSIVVALIDDEATVKRFFPEGDRIRFQPANSTMKPIYVDASEFRQTQILGIVVGIYRKM